MNQKNTETLSPEQIKEREAYFIHMLDSIIQNDDGVTSSHSKKSYNDDGLNTIYDLMLKLSDSQIRSVIQMAESQLNKIRIEEEKAQISKDKYIKYDDDGSYVVMYDPFDQA